jgi:tight adherence protein B
MNLTMFLIMAFVAGAAGLLAWIATEYGMSGVERYRASFTERARFQVQEFFLFIDPRTLFAANLAAMFIGALITWLVTGSLVIALPVFFALALMPRILYARMRLTRLRKFDEQLPDALMMLSGAMRAGAGLSTALGQLVQEAPAPLGQEFSLLLREQRLGLTMEQSLNGLSRRVPTQTTTLVVSAMRIASDTGGGLAETLERTAHTIRSRLQMEAKIGALTAQGKLQAWVVGLLPVGLGLILSKMEPEAMSMLWTTTVGWLTMIVLVILELMGVYVIRKIVAIDV